MVDSPTEGIHQRCVVSGRLTAAVRRTKDLSRESLGSLNGDELITIRSGSASGSKGIHHSNDRNCAVCSMCSARVRYR